MAPRSGRLRLFPLLMLGALLTACGDDGPVSLEVTVQDWTGWSREQPEPVVTSHELAEGDTFSVELIGDEELVVTVAQIGGDEVALETSEPMRADGGSLRDPRTGFSLGRGGAVEFGTPSMDGGTTITVAER